MTRDVRRLSRAPSMGSPTATPRMRAGSWTRSSTVHRYAGHGEPGHGRRDHGAKVFKKGGDQIVRHFTALADAAYFLRLRRGAAPGARVEVQHPHSDSIRAKWSFAPSAVISAGWTNRGRPDAPLRFARDARDDAMTGETLRLAEGFVQKKKKKKKKVTVEVFELKRKRATRTR